MIGFDDLMRALEDTAYFQWMRREGLPIIAGHGLEDVREIELSPWRRTGGKGAFIQLYGMTGATAMYVAEIPSGAALEPERHLYEEVIFILDGNGACEMWQDGEGKHLFEWGKWSVFSPPMNSWHRLINGSREPVRFLAVTNAPMFMDLCRNSEFIFNCPFSFSDRFAGEDGYFRPGIKRHKKGLINLWETNFIPDVGTAGVENEDEKGAGVKFIQFEIAGNSLIGHIAAWPAGGYHKAHYHDAGALLIGLQSKGYVILWPKELGIHPYEQGRQGDVVEMNWREGSVYCPPGGWFHQHFNLGKESARQMAIRFGSRKHPTGFSLVGGRYGDGQIRSIREGGTMIEYEDEDPEIRRRFKQALRANGVSFTMPEIKS
jgi:oxalate decarboxylase/phosphoglucose isomerase-like protein (cupin superfamily)